ncbi:MAG: orotidine-5'-phosphate decarboxylase [Melioribacteraceae bacterium]|nr:orotidine-5'-phosphate decarboxylase [Melioribacteraceae bacterium]
MNAQEKIITRLNQNLHICVGLDSDIEKIPKHLLNYNEPILEFNKIIIENTYQFAAAYKINFAFYEKYGAKGFEIIKQTLEFIPDNILTIADAKRGDIGNTSEMYAKAIFDELSFDAITLHPYMGYDSLNPFFSYKDKINFLLALTSNNGAEDFEKLKTIDGNFVFQHVIKKTNEWNKNKNLGIVFGATKIEELKENINSFYDLFILLPGVGAQGGSLDEVVSVFNKNKMNNYLINISRGLIYSDDTINFGNFIKKIIIEHNELIQKIDI